jgi:hypothetical protein
MEDRIIEGAVLLGVALLLMGISVPLIRGKISMNDVYGFRTKEACSSPEKWAQINARGGKLLFFSALLPLVIGIYLLAFANQANPLLTMVGGFFAPVAVITNCLLGGCRRS